MITNHQRHRRTDRQTDGQTDGRHAIPRPRICTKVHCAVKMQNCPGRYMRHLSLSFTWLDPPPPKKKEKKGRQAAPDDVASGCNWFWVAMLCQWCVSDSYTQAYSLSCFLSNVYPPTSSHPVFLSLLVLFLPVAYLNMWKGERGRMYISHFRCSSVKVFIHYLRLKLPETEFIFFT